MTDAKITEFLAALDQYVRATIDEKCGQLPNWGREFGYPRDALHTAKQQMCRALQDPPLSGVARRLGAPE